MAGNRQLKKQIATLLESGNWQENLVEIKALGQKAIASLFPLLLKTPEIRHRAAIALGKIIGAIAENDQESGKNYIRQYMWRMNEDSGNIGWGIPEAFAETLCQSPVMAREYARILLSYIIDLGFADNYCDYAPLRRSCFWAVGRLAQCRPDLVEPKRGWIVKGLSDEDEICRGMAAWSLSMLKPEINEAPVLKKLMEEKSETQFPVFENDKLEMKTVKEISQDCLHKWNM